MGLPESVAHLTPDDYLAWKNTQTEKHEYLNDEVFTMVGARREHVTATLHIAALLKEYLYSGPCHTYISDRRSKWRQQTLSSTPTFSSPATNATTKPSCS